jgi:hypothetical protein
MSDLIPVLVVGVLLLALPVAFVHAVATSAARFEHAGRSKAATCALILLTGGVGGLYYLLSIRPTLAAGTQA